MINQAPPHRPAPTGPTQGPRPSAPPRRRPQQSSDSRSIFQRAFDYIRKNILLRNITLAVCLGIILYFFVNLGLNLYTRHGQKYIVPTMIGHSVDEARQMAKKGDLRLEIIDSLYMPRQKPGTIIDQSPKPGMGVKSGRRVFLTINAFPACGGR